MSDVDKNRRSTQFLVAEFEEFLVDRQARNFTFLYPRLACKITIEPSPL
jgi:hypothetical protein